MAIRQWTPGESISFWVNRASRHVVRAQDEALKVFGFSMGHIAVLHALESGNMLTLTDLAKRANVELPSMTQMIARMERDGLVQRVRNPTDGRSVMISLTELSLSRLPMAKAALIEVENAVTGSFDDAERAEFQRLLKVFTLNIPESGP